MALMPIQQNQSTYPITFGPIILSSDHISNATGKTLTVTISKNGGAFASPSGAIGEVGNGIYEIAANATDSNTLGVLQIYATATGCDPYNDSCPVVAFNPYSATNLGLSALPTASPAASGGLITVGTGAGQITPDGAGNMYVSNGTGTGQVSLSSGKVLLQATQAGVTIPTVTTVTSATLASSQNFNNTGQSTASPSNTTQLAGQTVTAAAGVTFPTSVASPTNITGGTITTVTNLTNAPSSGDFTSAMKTSLNNATPASVTGSVASVTGNVGGNVVGSVGSVSGNVGGNVVGSVASVSGAVASVTGNVGGSVNSVTSAVTLATSQTFTNTNSANQTGDSFAIVNNGTYGNAAIKTIVSACQTILNKFGFDSNNNVNGSLAAILGTALTETTGYLAAGFKYLFNVASPVFSLTSTPQSGDSYPIVHSGTYGNAALLAALNLGIIFDSVTTVSPSATAFSGTSALSATDSQYVKVFLCFTSGVNTGVSREITTYTGSTKGFTFTSGFPAAPAQNDTYMLIGLGA